MDEREKSIGAQGHLSNVFFRCILYRLFLAYFAIPIFYPRDAMLKRYCSHGHVSVRLSKVESMFCQNVPKDKLSFFLVLRHPSIDHTVYYKEIRVSPKQARGRTSFTGTVSNSGLRTFRHGTSIVAM